MTVPNPRSRMEKYLDAIARGVGTLGGAAAAQGRVESLTETHLATGAVIEAVGNPIYVSDVTQYSAYGITETGWYVFARIKALYGDKVTPDIIVEGTAGYIAKPGNDYIDVAVRFEVAAVSQMVYIDWGQNTDTFVFKATDLAIRNMDYRVTFYVYDIEPYATWSFAQTTDVTYQEGKYYYVKEDGEYVPAEVTVGDQIEAYYVQKYELTQDHVFDAGKEYYTKNGSIYTLAEVSGLVPAYYVQQYALTTDETFVEGETYYTREGSVYTEATVTAGEAVTEGTYYVKSFTYKLTTDATFQEGTEYYTKEGTVYTEATVTAGEAVTANTYYVKEMTYVFTTDETFVDGVDYYTKNEGVYVPAEVTTGAEVPATYLHSKVRFEGMTRNITYRCNTVIDCPVEFVLPDVEDDCHGCWFEIRMRHAGSYSSTLIPPTDDVKIATEHTQAETKGMNMVNLHYSSVGGAKVWRFMNTHSSFAA